MLSSIAYVLLVTQEYDYGLRIGIAGGSQIVKCLRPVTYVSQLKINWTEVQPCLVGASSF